MSEVIEQYIRTHPGVSENEAFEGFAQQDRIRAWLAADPTRRERLRREFARVWTMMEDKSSSGGQRLAPPATRVEPAPPAPAPQAPAPAAGPALGPAGPAPARRVAIGGPTRKLNLLCPACEHVDVWAEGGHIHCRHCGHVYDNMLDLVPVKAVGPFAFFFGEGATGWLTAGGVVLLILLLYGVLKWA